MAFSVKTVEAFLDDLKSQEDEEEETTQKKKKKEEEVFLTEHDWKDVDEVIAALEPAREATRIMQGEQLLPGDFYALWHRCKLRTEKVTSDLAKAIVKNMEGRNLDSTGGTKKRSLPSSRTQGF